MPASDAVVIRGFRMQRGSLGHGHTPLNLLPGAIAFRNVTMLLGTLGNCTSPLPRRRISHERCQHTLRVSPPGDRGSFRGELSCHWRQIRAETTVPDFTDNRDLF